MNPPNARVSRTIVGIVSSTSSRSGSLDCGSHGFGATTRSPDQQRLQLNEEIRSFRRGANTPPKLTPARQLHKPTYRSQLVKQHPITSSFDGPQVSSSNQQIRQRLPVNRANTNIPKLNSSSGTEGGHPEVSMAQKVVHQQYNSPIDLYSMNNIRKTIEAHTELLAPGVKGINFMKAETPVNKQSEVYKLVMEEECEQQYSRPHAASSAASRLSPISGRPSTMPSAMVAGESQPQHAQQVGGQSRQVSFENRPQQSTTRFAEQQTGSKSSQQQTSPEQLQPEMQPNSKPPSCCECGQVIVGHYARIRDRSVHPHCFNCTTCGTSLKNTGYFTINEKLYCEIHARQMANILRIQYDFEAHAGRQARSGVEEPQQQQVTSSTTTTSSIQTGERTAQQQQQQYSYNRQEAQHEARAQTAAPDQNGSTDSWQRTRPAMPASGSPATIATMFADRSRLMGDASSVSSGARIAAARGSYGDSAAVSALAGARQHNQMSQQSRLHSTMESRHSNLAAGARVPVCNHCQAQVLGPYVLANRTTWCKPCSQTNFVCCSCRRSLLEVGFIEDGPHRYYCECCFEAHFAPACAKCNLRVKGDCLNALGKKWHPSCFVCGHCLRPFGNSSFYLEDNVPFCERDWNLLFTAKCCSCSLPIEAGDKWVEALGKNYHSNCFCCSTCRLSLEGLTFYCKGGRPYCRLHAR